MHTETCTSEILSSLGFALKCSRPNRWVSGVGVQIKQMGRMWVIVQAGRGVNGGSFHSCACLNICIVKVGGEKREHFLNLGVNSRLS